MSSMIVSIWAIANTYASSGWSLQIVNHETEAWTRERYLKDDQAILLKTLELDGPREEYLGELCDAHVEQMQSELVEAQTRIKEYQAKFLTLGAPTAEELS
jgi:hypothetical protein